MMSLIGSSIGRKIVSALVAIYVLTYVATAVVVYSGVRTSLRESAAQTLNQVADLKYERLGNRIDELATNLTAWSQLEVMNDLVSGDVDKRVDSALEGLKRLYGLTGDIYAFDSGGTLIAAADDIPPPEERQPPGGGRLPDVWRVGGRAPVFLDKHPNPLANPLANPPAGNDIVALAIPVFGSFDRNFRVGTLVVTLPWPTLETLLGGLESSTALVRLGRHPVVLSPRAGNIAALAPPSAGGGNNDYIIGRSVTRDGLLRDWQVVVLQPVAAVTRPLRQVALELVLLGVCLGIPVIISVRWMARRLTAPVMDLTRVVRDITDTDRLDIRVPVTGHDELGFLAGSFNRMTSTLQRAMEDRDRSMRELALLNQTLEGKVTARTAELEAAITAQRRLLRDISHEIKSPLARLGMALGLARRQAEAQAPRHFDRMEREIAAVAALASELLTLARLEGTANGPAPGLDVAAVDLPVLLREIIADALYEMPDRQGDVTLTVTPDPATGGTVDGNADLLRRAIENIIRNALFYTAPGDLVVITLTPAAGGLHLTVADQGPGVPDDALALLFEPFYRVDQARARETGGTGIGLTICKRVVELHGGRVAARRNHPHGLVIDLTLPVRQDGGDPGKTG